MRKLIRRLTHRDHDGPITDDHVLFYDQRELFKEGRLLPSLENFFVDVKYGGFRKSPWNKALSDTVVVPEFLKKYHGTCEVPSSFTDRIRDAFKTHLVALSASYKKWQNTPPTGEDGMWTAEMVAYADKQKHASQQARLRRVCICPVLSLQTN
jgi:hypothetical protein